MRRVDAPAGRAEPVRVVLNANVFLSALMRPEGHSAAFVVTGDRHLLDVGEHQDVRMVTPRQLLALPAR